MNSRDGVAAAPGGRLGRSARFAEQCLELGVGVGERLVPTGEQRDRIADGDLAALVDECAHEDAVLLGFDVDGRLRRLDRRQHAAGGERCAFTDLP